MDFEDKAPFVPPQLVEWLEKKLSLSTLLAEAPTEGLEQLGFIKGAQFAIDFLKAAKMRQEDVL